MAIPAKARQTIPLWSLRTGAAGCDSAPRSARIIPLPAGAARQRRVLTYPAAIAVPPRSEEAPQAPERPLAPLTLLALTAPSAVLGCGMLLVQLLA
ncbi:MULTISPECIES: hypothetical protein [Roseomonadaceae]|uniref:Uncharacterized protein n=1 Tax=Falsiroseomonas oleicola TaxID=2801474 RepID=A0ABS6H9B7_9PROT|nr:hypothetical protein [Roseomonas oleicola]MBU8545312.1 hypothetical protein [Roseomonas oleicola]